jgi:hypothetical protein
LKTEAEVREMIAILHFFGKRSAEEALPWVLGEYGPAQEKMAEEKVHAS